ncbi:MAG: T9SS type A sorting domain-containing protein [Chitinophagaceae bacterium]|nr:MAG: T9SS type A sorting domain-containing protein [Chitinophagaceae bacterium]
MTARILLRFLCPLLLLAAAPARAQHFDWAAAGSNLNGGFSALTVDPQGNIIAAGSVYLFSNFYHGPSWLLSSSNDSLEVHSTMRPMLVVSYAPNGSINWRLEVPGCSAPRGIAIDGKGRIRVLAETDAYGRARVPGLDPIYDSRRVFLLTLSPDGKPLSAVTDTAGRLENATDFRVVDGAHFLVSGTRNYADGRAYGSAAHYLVKLGEDLQPLWEQEIPLKGSGGVFDPGVRMDVAPSGDIFLAGSYLNGAQFPGSGPHDAAAVQPETEYSKHFESYVACFGPGGKPKWVRHSGGRSILRSVNATRTGVVVGGEIVNNAAPFGRRADTTGGRRMLLASLSAGGQVGWVRSSRADKVQELTSDREGNVYASVSSKVFDSLVFETDTLRYTFETLIIASYAPDGAFRWVKNTRLPMNYNERVLLRSDGCGNLYVGGELWATLRMQLRWFDGAFIRGDAYGDAPFVARIRNTLPETVARRGAADRASCRISPAPWTISNFPNPFAAHTTIRYRTTYDDAVSLQLYDMGGRLVSVLQAPQQRPAGTHLLPFSRNGLAAGAYLLVLRGTGATASTQVLIR